MWQVKNMAQKQVFIGQPTSPLHSSPYHPSPLQRRSALRFAYLDLAAVHLACEFLSNCPKAASFIFLPPYLWLDRPLPSVCALLPRRRMWEGGGGGTGGWPPVV